MAINLEIASQIKAMYRPRTTRGEVIEYFQEKYPAVKYDKKGKPTYEWKTKITDAELALNPGAKRASIARRYQRDTKTGKDRYLSTKPSKKQQEEYKALGKTIPGIAPDAIRVYGTVCIRYADNPCEPREFDEVLRGEELDFFLQSYDMQILINKYMEVDLDERDPSIQECPCNGEDCECNFGVEAVEDDYVPTKVKRKFKEGNVGAKTKPKLPSFLASKKKAQAEDRPTVRLKSQAEIVAEMDAFQKERGK